MGSFPEAYNDPTWIIIRRLSNHFCGRNIEIFWTYILLFLVHFFNHRQVPLQLHFGIHAVHLFQERNGRMPKIRYKPITYFCLKLFARSPFDFVEKRV